MTLKDLLFNFSNEDILNRMMQLYPKWFDDKEVDCKAEYMCLLELLKAKNYSNPKENFAQTVVFMIKFEDRWNLPGDEEYVPYTYEVFTMSTKTNAQEDNNLPYGLAGYEIVELFLLEIYPKSLKLTTKLDFLCHALHEVGIYGQCLLNEKDEEKFRYNGQEKEKIECTECDIEKDDKYYDFETIKNEFLQELEIEFEKDPAFKEYIDKLDKHIDKMADLYYCHRAELMEQIKEYYKE